MKKKSYKKSERLKSKKIISQLFSNGKHVFKYPFKLVYLPMDHKEHPLYFSVSVSKRNFRKAVSRNRIKRKIKEAYRIHKNEFISHLNNEEKSYAIMAIYVGKKEEPFVKIEKNLISVFKYFMQKK